MPYPGAMTTPTALLDAWLDRSLSGPAREWLAGRVAAVGDGDVRALETGFGLIPRKTGKADLKLADADLAAADAVRPGWDPRELSADRAARQRLLLALPSANAETWRAALERLFVAADVGESIALYRALPLLPHPETLVGRAVEGLRTNITAAFAAIATANPFPAETFAEGAWNQMVLKATFIGVELRRIRGLDARTNPALARMLVDYAHERWAAGRAITPEVWRCVYPHARAVDALDDLRRVLASEDPVERRAGALALRELDQDAVASRPDLAAALASGELSWDRIPDPQGG